MSDKRYNFPQTQGVDHVHIPVTVNVPTLGYHPAMGEGDQGSVHFQVQRGATGPVTAGYTGATGGPTGMTGIVLLKTRDPFPAIVSIPQAGVAFPPAPSGPVYGYGLRAEQFRAVQNSDHTWEFGVYILDANGVRTDPPVGTVITFSPVFRNSRSKP